MLRQQAGPCSPNSKLVGGLAVVDDDAHVCKVSRVSPAEDFATRRVLEYMGVGGHVSSSPGLRKGESR